MEGRKQPAEGQSLSDPTRPQRAWEHLGALLGPGSGRPPPISRASNLQPNPFLLSSQLLFFTGGTQRTLAGSRAGASHCSKKGKGAQSCLPGKSAPETLGSHLLASPILRAAFACCITLPEHPLALKK